MKSIAWAGLGRLGLLLLLAAAAGCGAGRGKVSGRVLLNGEPVPGGWLSFRPADPKQNAVPAKVDDQGNYEAVLPVGEVFVSVTSGDLPPRGPRVGGLPPGLPLSPEVQKTLEGGRPEQGPANAGGNAPAPQGGKYVAIPPRYADAATSGLQFRVEGGDQTHNLELSD
jgi:hypothetical protein